MKFGLGTDPVSLYSFKVVTGFAASEDPLKDSVKFLTHVDGSVEVMEFGSRQERQAEFTLAQIPKEQFVILVDFLSARTGEKIHITEENPGEKLFTESFLSPDPLPYFAYLLEVGGMQEEDFSPTRSLFSLNLKIAFAHLSELDPHIPSKLDVLIDIDTVRADFVSPVAPSLQPQLLREGMRWLDTGVGFPEGAEYALRAYTVTDPEAEPPQGNWERILYTVPADIPELGFRNGIFRLAAFSDVSYDLNSYGEDDPQKRGIYLSGWLNYQSIELPGKSINLSKGPSIAHREGFSFSINNSNGTAPKRFWAFVVERKINLFGARCSISIYRNRDRVTVTRLMSGVNRSNSFSYTDYKFQVEPFLLTDVTKFPSTVIDPRLARYADAPKELIGKPPYLTYGEHDMAALQLISSQSANLEFGFRNKSAEGKVSTGATQHITGYIDLSYEDPLNAAEKAQDAVELNVDSPDSLRRIIVPSSRRFNGASTNFPSSYEISAGQILALSQEDHDHLFRITFDNDEEIPPDNDEGAPPHNRSNNAGQVVKILRVRGPEDFEYRVQEAGNSEQGGYLFIVEVKESQLNLPLARAGDGTAPGTDSAIGLTVVKATFKYQSGESLSGGFGTIENGAFSTDTRALYNLKESQKELVQIPTTEFTEADGNLVKIDPVLVVDSNKALVFRDSQALFGEAGAPLSSRLTAVVPRTSQSFLPIDENIIGSDSRYFNARFAGNPDSSGHPFLYTRRLPETSRTSAADLAAVVATKTLNDTEVEVIVNPQLLLGIYPSADHEERESGFCALVARVPINHDNDSILISGKSDIRMAMKMELRSMLFLVSSPEYREIGVDITMAVRFKRFTGAYANTVKKLEFPANTLSLRGSRQEFGCVMIDNLPDGLKNGNFNTRQNDLAPMYDFLIRRKFVNMPIGVRVSSSSDAGSYLGELSWDSNTNRLISWDGGFWIVAETQPVAGNILYVFRNSKKGPFFNNLFKVASNGTLDPITTDLIQTQSGGDLFELKALFDSPDSEDYWTKLESMEILVFPSGDPRKTEMTPFDQFTPAPEFLRYELKLRMHSAPRLMLVDELKLENRPAFSALRGKEITGPSGLQEGFPSSALAVAADILKTIYPRKFDKAAFFSEPSLAASRVSNQWVWRKQFTKASDSTRVLQELLENLWASAIFDEEDNLRIKSLNLGDYADVRVFDESNVLQDSIAEPRFRPMGETFQVYKLDYDFFPPSEFSNALEKHRKRLVFDGDKVEDSLSYFLRSSQDLYQLRNEFTRQYDYHYAGATLPFAEWLVRWFSFSSSTLKFKVSLDEILGEGNRLELMDRVSLENFFYTRVPGRSRRDVEGFVVSIKPDLYNGTAEIGMYVPEPPGTFGPLCDPFRDALEIPDRGDIVPLWTERGWIHDAGDFYSPRGEAPVLRDAGNFPRVISC
jgi:hypothetical protein